jgi:hypothetical protein
MASITDLYRALRADSRLPREWERCQPRIDRALESVPIARTTREVATAALLTVKLKYEPAAAGFSDVRADDDLLHFAQGQGSGGAQLGCLLAGKRAADAVAVAAAVHTLRFYRDRFGPNELVRLPWSRPGLRTVTGSQVFSRLQL